MNWRKIVVNNKTYKYRIGRQNVVIVEDINEGEENKTVVSFSTLTNMSPNDIERAKWKRYFSITPSDIANYIKSNIKED